MLGTFCFCLGLLLISMVCSNFVVIVQLLLIISFTFSLKLGSCNNLYSFLSFSSFTLDSMSMNLILLSFWCTLLMVLGSFYISKKSLNEGLFLVAVILLMIILLMGFMMSNLLSFYICFELSLIPTFFLIMKWGYQPERIQASLYMLLYTICASLPLLVSILYMNLNGMSLNMVFPLELNSNYIMGIWGLFLMGAFFVKMPLYFTHLWLPKAHVEAPVAGSMILAGVLLKLGSYGLIRVSSMWFTFIYKFSEVFMCISLMGGALTGMICMVQSDLKSLIAYSSIGHMGILTGGILSMSWFGVMGSVIMMVAHGLCSSGMFYLSNTYYQNSKSRSVLMNKGVLHAFPFMVMFSFLIFSCNMSAPPSINLAGELVLSMGVLSFSYISAIPIALMTLLAGGYSMYLYVLSSHGNILIGFNSWKEMKDYDLICIFLHFLPIWGIILNLKMYI